MLANDIVSGKWGSVETVVIGFDQVLFLKALNYSVGNPSGHRDFPLRIGLLPLIFNSPELASPGLFDVPLLIMVIQFLKITCQVPLEYYCYQIYITICKMIQRLN